MEKLLKSNANIVGICTKKQSLFNADYRDLKPLADKYKIPSLYTKSINDKKVITWARDLNPDMIFCFGWSEILKKEVLEIPLNGVLGYHPTILPQNKGRHPIIWSLVLGLNKTASTFIMLDSGIDTGKIVDQKIIRIHSTDTSKDLYDRLTNIAWKQMKQIIKKIQNDKLNLIDQKKGNFNTWRKRNYNDGQIDWRMTAKDIFNLVRALTRPYVGAHFFFESREIKVWKCKIVKCKNKDIEPGKVLEINAKNVLIKTGLDSIRIVEFSPKINLKVGDYI